MIAASHIGSTTTTNAMNGANPGRRDADAGSFRDSLGEASQVAHLHAASGHSQETNKDAKRDKESASCPKIQPKKTDDSGEPVAAVSPNAAAADQTPLTMTLPSYHLFSAGASTIKSDSGASVSSSTDVTSTAQPEQAQSGSWSTLAASPAWLSSNALSQTDNTGAEVSGSGIGESADDGADESESVQASAAQVAPLVDSANRKAVASAQAEDASAAATTLAAQRGLQPTPADGLLAAAQAASNQNASPLLPGQQTGSNPFNIGGVASAKANASLKGLQSIANSAKSASTLVNSPTAGAKQTDSYLSIQKDGKADETLAAKDNSAITSTQHGVRNEQGVEAFVAPVVTSQQNHIAVAAEAHPQNVVSSSASAVSSKPAQDTLLSSAETQAGTTVATPQASATAMQSAVVNSAKLIQTIGQSEMRVGMRTADFGDISIRTSSSRDSISAQISLGHSDLAQTLTTHMPEMQTRLTSGEVVDVHIHHENQTGSFGSQSNDAGQSGSQNQTNEESTSRASLFGSYSARATTAASVPAAVMTSRVVASGRLDIRA